MKNAIKVLIGLSLGSHSGGLWLHRRVWLGNGDAPQASVASAVDNSGIGDQVEEVAGIVGSRGLNRIKEASATAGAIQGLLESNGDKYGTYFDTQHFEFFNEGMGEFGGSAWFSARRTARPTSSRSTRRPLPRRRNQAGDDFMEIDGPPREWTSQEVVKRVRGKEGTTSILCQRPAKKGEARGVLGRLERAMIELPNIESKLYDKVGYIRLGQFNTESSDDLTKAIESLRRRAPPPTCSTCVQPGRSAR